MLSEAVGNKHVKEVVPLKPHRAAVHPSLFSSAIASLTAILLMLSHSAILASERPIETVRVTIPAPMAFEFLPFILGRERGIYRSQDISLELPILRPQLSVAAVLSGEADYISTLISPARAAVEGLPFKILMVLFDRPLFHVVAQPGIQSVKDLRGKTVASGQLKSGSQLSVASLIRSGGLNPDHDVQWAYLPDADQALAALVSRAIDATMLAPPLHVRARRLGFRDLGEVGRTFSAPIHGLATLDKRVKENPAQVRGLILSTLQSVAYVREHPEEVIAEIEKRWKVDSETARDSYRLMVGGMTPDGKMAEPVFLQSLGDVLAGEGISEERTRSAVKNLLDYEWLRQAHKELEASGRK